MRAANLSVLLVAVVVAFLAVSSQSLWIDEANSVFKAVQPTWADFCQAMASERGSDAQMPLYMTTLWGWGKVFGPGEYVLRCMNIPLFIGAIGVVFACLSLPQWIRLDFCFFALCSPMVWVYLDEARPYMLQFFSATLLMVGLLNLCSKQGEPALRDAVLVFVGIVLLCGSSLMGVIYSFFFGLAFLACWFRRESLLATLRRPGLWILTLLSVFALAGLAAYYVWTLKVGARASGVGKTNLMSMAFCAYELLGFTGAGPGRIALRDNPLGALRPFMGFLALYAAMLAAFLLVSIKAIRPFSAFSRLSVFLPVFFAVLASAATVLILGVVADFRILGRHLMPVLPLFLLGFSWLAWSVWGKGKLLGRFIVVTTLFAGLISCVSVRFAPRFAKDDYRSAASVAKDALWENKTVWWAADPAAANYYGLFPQTGATNADCVSGLLNSPPPGTAFFANGRSAEYLAALPRADVVILSKEDIYDGGGALRAWMKVHDFVVLKTFPAFTVWERKSENE